MTRYVSLSTDAAPTYAVHAPVAARLWLRLGYRTIIHVEDSARWQTRFGDLVLGELRDVGAAIVRIPRTPPLSLPNTMRAARLVAPWVNGLFADDYIILADVDMYPLDRAFFSNPADFTVLRALYASWLACTTPPPAIDWSLVTADKWRFQMCYAGATVGIWREMWSLPYCDSPAALRTLLEGTTADAMDFDEAKLSYAFLSSPRAQGPWETLDATQGVWRRGELVFVDPITAPLLSRYYNMPRGLVGPEDEEHAKDLRAIDLIPPRFGKTDRPWWSFDIARMRWPEESDWLASYRERLEKTLEGAQW